MPIDHKKSSTIFSQRKIYEKGGIGRWYWDFRDKIIFSFIKEEHKNILDIGCGEGITLEKLINKYKNLKVINGIDVMEENVKICQGLGLPVISVSVYDLKLKFGKDSVDLCILSETIEHLENVELAFDNLRRVLKIGGEVIIVFTNDFIIKMARLFFFKFKEAFADVGHLRKFTPKTLRELLENNGFEIVLSQNIPFWLWIISLHGIIVARKI